MREATNSSENVHALRSSIMVLVSAFMQSKRDPKVSEVLGALAACLCDTLLLNGTPLDDKVFDSIRKTYELCEMQQAMSEKDGETVQ